ncbi:MAG: aminotransferase class V-fold PLP-dependent enzyme [Alphaproteobacteria bacterium]|nr:aminotransferase class V-fold PLP-dependent enzyme [Alphaproteobacteria bacterium]
MRIETAAVHAGTAVDEGTQAVTPPIVLSTTFARAADGGFPGGHVYTRTSNPNRGELETAMAALEGGEAATAFASGMAAVAAIFQSLAPGDRVLVPSDVYHGTVHVLRQVFQRWGLAFDLVDMADLTALDRAIGPQTRLVWIETPSNPMLRVVDVAAIAARAHAAGAVAAVDNTWATPLLQRPLDLGCDLVMHSTTKYLGGHSDVLGGIVVTRRRDAFFERLEAVQRLAGAVPSPFDCWLVRRGIRSLAARMRMHCENAEAVAQFLVGHPLVERVHYPGLPGHPGHDIARRQMRGFGGMLSFEVAGGREAAMAVAAGVEVFTRATSLGGVESLIEHRASIEGPESRTPPSLLRVSVGLESAEDLVADLHRALATLQ